ncbi:halocyanin domain-containing protein [Halorarius halobius]|uniref:halocyanin domain-containing protein n=1 Tax=Halorarius halobius TaxID=2962671 RepID=UPI0020CDF572|nr:halocyanin domain-containing protein [Halorarius halobius]
MQRRTLLAASAGTLASLAGCTGGGGGTEGYGDWFSNVENYDGELDRTGQSTVEVTVGAEGGLSFAPAAIVVDSGTTVRWTWTGKGGRHNVVERDGAFESEYHETEGATYERTFDETGVFPYFCQPHQSMGMKGGVRVE